MTLTKKIQCPHCGNKKSFNLVETLDTEDEVIRDLYHCSKCDKKSVRYYKFVKWESPKDKKKKAGFFVNTNYSSMPKGL